METRHAVAGLTRIGAIVAAALGADFSRLVIIPAGYGSELGWPRPPRRSPGVTGTPVTAGRIGAAFSAAPPASASGFAGRLNTLEHTLSVIRRHPVSVLLALFGGLVIGAIAAAGDWSTAGVYGGTRLLVIVFVPAVVLLHDRRNSRKR